MICIPRLLCYFWYPIVMSFCRRELKLLGQWFLAVDRPFLGTSSKPFFSVLHLGQVVSCAQFHQASVLIK